MYRVFPKFHKSLPLIEVDGSIYLIDTGATQSSGTAGPGVSELGRLLAPPEAMEAVQQVWPQVCEAARELGYHGQLDGLVGVDRLAALDVLVDAPNGFIALRPRHVGEDAHTDEGTQLASEVRFGLPCVQMRFVDRTLLAVLDTGASLGYFVGDPPRLAERGPEASDHNPMVGRFTAPTYEGALFVTCASGEELSLGPKRLGRIDGFIERGMRSMGLDAVVGDALWGTLAVRFTQGLSRVDVLNAQVHDELAPHYAPMFDDMYNDTLAKHGEHLATKAANAGAQRVLDVGAGAGTVSLALLERDIAVVAVEPSRGMAGVLAQQLLQRRRDVDVAVFLGGAEDLGALDIEPVDVVLFAFGVVDYLIDDESLHRALAGAHARTRKGGRCWLQPAPRTFMVSVVIRGERYRREVRAQPGPDTSVIVCDHRVFLDDVLVSEEQISFRPRTLDELCALATKAGWAYESVDEEGVYPTLCLVRE